MSVQLYIQDILIKQFPDKEEEILINRKLKDYRDIDKIYGDYTESFTVPANANNEVFKHYYDADIDGGFDARVKQDAYIELDGQLWKRGEVQLIDVELKHNRAESYKLQFFGEVTQLVDLFGEDELKDLDFSDLVFDYTYANVKQGLESGLFNNQIIYPLLSYKRRLLYNTTATGLDPELNADISKGGTSDFEGIQWRELKPAVKTETIFNKIQSKYGITFQGDIFNDFRFTNMYMNLVNQKRNQGETDTILVNSFVTLSGTSYYNTTETTITPDTGYEDVLYGKRLYINDTLVFDSGMTYKGTSKITHQDSQELSELTYRVEIYGVELFHFAYRVDFTAFTVGSGTQPPDEFTSTGNDILTTVVNLSNLFQEFKIRDFIKAFVSAFNLVLIPIDDTNIFFQSLQPWYAQGRVIDVTPYIKTDRLKVASGDLVSGIDMFYDKTETFLSAVFLENNNRSHGKLEVDFQDSNGKPFNGNKLTVKLPFEKIVFERIGDILYGYLVNREQEEFNPFHSIFYSLLRSTSVYLKNSNGIAEELIKIRTPSTSVVNGGFALNFENEIDEYNRNVSTSNFYTRYYADYVDDLFSPKRRQYNLEARLPKFISQDLKLNDRLLIGQSVYLINSLQQNLTTDNIKFELLNDIFTGAEALNQIIAVEDDLFTVEKQAVTLTTNKVGSSNIASITSSETFVTPSFNNGVITLDVAENTTSLTRNSVITVTFDDVSNTQVLIRVIQND